MYLEQVSNKNEKEILKLSYPKFMEYINFYTDSKEFLKPKMPKDQQLSELERIKKLKQSLEG